MSYRTMRQSLREMSLASLERIRHEISTASRSSRSPAKRVRLDGLLNLVQAAIVEAYERIEIESMCA
jgi:hypothetical protein